MTVARPRKSPPKSRNWQLTLDLLISLTNYAKYNREKCPPCGTPDSNRIASDLKPSLLTSCLS